MSKNDEACMDLNINNSMKTYKEIPDNILKILNDCNCPGLLIRHLILVYNTGMVLTEKIKYEFPDLKILDNEIQFGLATHDIGKSIKKNELKESGKEHEQIGYELLIDYGVNKNLARFTITHSDWKSENINIEDLIVSLSDKIWKGQRIDELEEELIRRISISQNIDYWVVYSKLDCIISEIIIGADERLNWQN